MTPELLTLPANAPPAFHLLAKPTGAVCNLDCSYCFFLPKETLYPGSRFRMAGLLRQGRYADEIMEIMAEQEKAAFAGAGRNGPCPCGSGKKFKHCHGR